MNLSPDPAEKESRMNEEPTARKVTRSDLLKVGGLGIVALAGGGSLAAVARGGSSGAQSHINPLNNVIRRLASTDGFISLPGRPEPMDLYVFGFVEHAAGTTTQIVQATKGNARVPSPILAVDEYQDTTPSAPGYKKAFVISLTNVGFVGRPDLDDSHTIHWHGFRDAIPAFDGTPELSFAAGVNRTLPYAYVPRHPGTYIYHCHFEDSEHVQMGMTGVVFIRPKLGPKYAYNDASTLFDREFSLLLNEVDARPHDGLIGVQEFVWSEYRPQYWIINGRSYPDTIKPNKGEVYANPLSIDADPNLVNQPVSSLIQVRGGDKVLLRIPNLGYEQHSMVLPGITMKVIGEDATLLRGPLGADLSYETNTLYIGPGETRDVLFTAPAFAAGSASGSSPYGPWNTYFLKNRNYDRQSNNGLPGLGGMVTEVRVFNPANPPASLLPAQGPNDLNKTYETYA